MKYTHPGIRPRRKGERYDPTLLLSFCYEGEAGEVLHDNFDGVPAKVIGTCKVVGTHVYFPAEYIEVTLTDGTVVPATRLRAGGDKYVICQNLSFKAAKPNGAANPPRRNSPERF